MKVTPEIVQHEFIGLKVKVAKSANPDCVRIKGKIIDETRNTFVLKQNGTEKRVIKETSVFHFTYPDGTIVEIDGKILVGRPEDRIKKPIRRRW
ncbi:TPA: ribonuclease P protein subunit [Candidatus Bathyarchaeota archaeon]|nr:ribonuclease P protein subunit [Candidatus Bathyarchaeota archaeon]